MPSISMKRIFKRRNKSPTNNDKLTKSYGDRSTPPLGSPIDPDGSTASHDSNEIYISQPGSPRSPGGVDAPPETLTASQFKEVSDEEMENKRAHQQPLYSPHYAPKDQPKSKKQGMNCTTKSRDGVPIITSSGADHFSPSAVSSKSNFGVTGFYSKSKKTFGGKERPKVRPSAKNSAFGGAPRYDWMDIETTAAIKIQALYRRVQVQNDLHKLGVSTPGMRNRRAQRQARYQARMSRNAVTSNDVPFPFSLCGVGLLFGDATFEDEKIVDDLEKKRVQKMKKGHEREDEEKRKFRMRKKESQHLEEGIEVVESFDGEEEEKEESVVVEEESVSPKMKMQLAMGKSSRKSMSPKRGKSKRLSRNMNEFDPNEDDQSL